MQKKLLSQTSSKNSALLSMSSTLQFVVVGVVVIAWLNTWVPVLLQFNKYGVQATEQLWIYFWIHSFLLPIATLLAFTFTRKHAVGLRLQLSVAALIALLSLIVYSVLISLAQIVNVSLFSESLLAEVGSFAYYKKEYVIMLVWLTIYVGALGIWEWRLTHKK